MKVKNFGKIKLYKIHIKNRSVLFWTVKDHIIHETKIEDYTLFQIFITLVPEYKFNSNIYNLTRRYAIFFAVLPSFFLKEPIDSLSCGMIWEQPNENYEF